MLLKVESLAHVPVKVTPHQTLNSSKGVVRSRELASCDVAEITSELKSQGVTDAVIISVRDGSDEGRRKTNTVILTFNRPQPPSHITAGYLRIPVARYIPNPLRCFNCQRYGHGKAHCRRQQTCSRCGEVGHDQPDCQQREHCVNCDGNHSAASKLCPKWKLEKRVQQIRVDNNVPFKQARELAIAEQVPSGPTMANVASASSTTVRGPQTRPRVQTSEAKCQTEFTWPDSEQFPVRLQEADNTSQTSRSTNTSQTISDVRANPRQAQRGARTDYNERNSSKHSGGGSRLPRIQRPPSQTAGQAETASANSIAALQSVHMEGVEATDTSIT